jgi:hypothetical protein
MFERQVITRNWVTAGTVPAPRKLFLPSLKVRGRPISQILSLDYPMNINGCPAFTLRAWRLISQSVSQ